MELKNKIYNSIYSLVIILSFPLIVHFISLQNDDGYNFMPGFVFIIVWIIGIPSAFYIILRRFLNYPNEKKLGYNFIGILNLCLSITLIFSYVKIGSVNIYLLLIAFIPLLFGILILLDIYTKILDKR
jgi:hypothetical protein